MNEYIAGDIKDLSIPVAATVLTILDQDSAPQAARDLLTRTEEEIATLKQREDLIDIITSIMVYKFANLSRQEIRAMLGLDLTTEPRAIREAKDEGPQEGRIEGQRMEALTLIMRLLTRRLKQELPEQMRLRLVAMPLARLEELSEALLDFSSIADLENWLSEND